MHVDMLIIGGGISGLGMAWHCQKAGLSTRVLEQHAQVGGLIASRQQPEQTGDFWLELGAHSAFNSYQELLAIVADCQLQSLITPKKSPPFKFFKAGKLQSLLKQIYWFSLLRALPRLFSLSKENLSVQDYYTQIMGEKTYDALMQHAFNAVLCQDARHFPADLLFRKRARARDTAKKFTFAAGMQHIARALAETLEKRGVLFHVETPVIRLEYRDHQFEITTADQRTFSSRFLTLATPVETAAQLLSFSFPSLATLLSQIKMATVHSVGVAVRKEEVRLPIVGGIIGADSPFYSVVSRDYLWDARYRGLTFHFKADFNDPLAQEQLIADLLGIKPSQFLWRDRKINQLPALTVDNLFDLAQITAQLQHLPLALIGNYFNGVSIEDCLVRTRGEFQRLQAQMGTLN
ncbi:protoporphyrinogen/coproporphyrinogen oxidase [Thioflexithrix psekupsensis]|nr:FAD-dependent oxidoreductase [Thioflexithrix psekupsensis]